MLLWSLQTRFAKSGRAAVEWQGTYPEYFEHINLAEAFQGAQYGTGLGDVPWRWREVQLQLCER